MKITDIGIYKGETAYIELDDGEKVFVHQSMIYEFHLQKGMDIPQSGLDEVVHANQFRKAKERALYLLDRKDYSYTELFNKLDGNYDEDICFAVCNRLAELGLINDRRYAERLAEYYMVTKRFGRYRARQEMARRGIGDRLIDEAIAEYEDTAEERLEELVEQKYERYLTSWKGVEKVKGALARLGYSYSQIKDVLDLYDFDFDE